MNFEAALDAQQEVFQRAFGYTEIPGAADLGFGKAGPFFVSPHAVQAAQRGEALVGPALGISVGIGLADASTGHHVSNRNFELVVYCQEKRYFRGPVVEQIVRVARGEARVVLVGKIRRTSWHQSNARPLRIGCSVGHRLVAAGTIGCLVGLDDGRKAILSNNHVLANTNRASPGDAILQPGKTDGGIDPADRVATLHSFVPINFQAAARNFVDAAVATLLPGIGAECSIYDGTATIGRCNAAKTAELDIGDPVIKVGRTTGLTRGRVQAVNVNQILVAMTTQGSQQVARFDGQIAIEGVEGGAFSKSGDSGALVMTENLNPAALCFAGSQKGGANGLGISFANPIDPVLNALKCSILAG